MENFVQSPMFRVTVPFLGGCVLHRHAVLPDTGLWWQLWAVAILLLLAFLMAGSWKYRWLAGLATGFCLFLAGHAWTEVRTAEARAMVMMDTVGPGRSRIFIAEAASGPQDRNGQARLILEILHAYDGNRFIAVGDVTCLAYFRRDSLAVPPARGDRILFRARLQEIQSPANPGEFDFKRYMAGRNVFLRTWVEEGKWRLVGHRNHFLLDLAADCREFVYGRLKDAGIMGQELELAASLLLGQKDGLEQDTRQSFTAAGAMHVLCVSGLHVGIIFVVLNFLFKGFYRIKYGRVIRFLLVVALIWFYALLTGMSPSVMRASLMFSLLQAGKLMKNPPPTVNTLASSAFILALLDPLVVSSIGFQFSYLAVLGIITIVPALQLIWCPGVPLLGKIWSLLLVSLAAQIGTGPLSVHYFHQFPAWFLLTNLAVIPLASVILYLALMVMALPLEALYQLAGKALSASLGLMLESVRLVESLPGAVISSIDLSVVSTLVLYLFFIFFFLMITSKSKKYLFIALSVLIGFIMKESANRMALEAKKEIYVYHLKGNGAFDIIDGRKCYAFYAQEDTPGQTISYSMAPNRERCRIKQLVELHAGPNARYDRANLFIRGDFIGFNGYRIFVPGKLNDKARFPDQADLVILQKDFEGSVSALDSLTAISELVIDGSVPPWKAKDLERECNQLGIRCHVVAREGCFFKTLSRQ